MFSGWGPTWVQSERRGEGGEEFEISRKRLKRGDIQKN